MFPPFLSLQGQIRRRLLPISLRWPCRKQRQCFRPGCESQASGLRMPSTNYATKILNLSSNFTSQQLPFSPPSPEVLPGFIPFLSVARSELGTLYAALVFPVRQDSAQSQKRTGPALF